MESWIKVLTKIMEQNRLLEEAKKNKEKKPERKEKKEERKEEIIDAEFEER